MQRSAFGDVARMRTQILAFDKTVCIAGDASPAGAGLAAPQCDARLLRDLFGRPDLLDLSSGRPNLDASAQPLRQMAGCILRPEAQTCCGKRERFGGATDAESSR